MTGMPWIDAGLAVGQIGFGIADAMNQNNKYKDMLRESREEQKRLKADMALGGQRTQALTGNLQSTYNTERNADKANMTANSFLNTLQGWRQEKMGLESALAAEKQNYGNIKSQIRSGWDIAGTALGQGLQAVNAGMDKYNTDNLMKSQIAIQNKVLEREGLPLLSNPATVGDALSGVGKSLKSFGGALSGMYKSSETTQANKIASDVPYKPTTDNDLMESTRAYMDKMRKPNEYSLGFKPDSYQKNLLGPTYNNTDRLLGIDSRVRTYRNSDRNISFNPYTNYNPWYK